MNHLDFLYVVKSVGSQTGAAYFKIGETLTFNQSEGNEPSFRDLEKITCRIGAISQKSFEGARL